MNSVAPGTTKHLFLSLSDVFVLLVWLIGCIFARLVGAVGWRGWLYFCASVRLFESGTRPFICCFVEILFVAITGCRFFEVLTLCLFLSREYALTDPRCLATVGIYVSLTVGPEQMYVCMCCSGQGSERVSTFSVVTCCHA